MLNHLASPLPPGCRESVAINSSLMTLGRCLEVLRWNQQHKGAPSLRVVPYRESKVTHLFRCACLPTLLAGTAGRLSAAAPTGTSACPPGGRHLLHTFTPVRHTQPAPCKHFKYLPTHPPTPSP